MLEDLTGAGPGPRGGCYGAALAASGAAGADRGSFYACYSCRSAAGGLGVSTLGTALLVEDAARSGSGSRPLPSGRAEARPGPSADCRLRPAAQHLWHDVPSRLVVGRADDVLRAPPSRRPAATPRRSAPAPAATATTGSSTG
jgi:hypothetical protein